MTHPQSSQKFGRRSLLPLTLCLCGLLIAANPAIAQKKDRPKRSSPTMKDVPYGSHERHVLDFWQAKGDGPRPLAIYIHGGGFFGGSKTMLRNDMIQPLLDSGISVAALHYRRLDDAPVPAAHHDCRRAIQFLRTKAEAWNLDPNRFGTFGSSAGAQVAMYLAFHDDMAIPDSEDELERQSTRVTCVATAGAQTTIDIRWWLQNLPGYDKPHRDELRYFGEIIHDREKFDDLLEDISALSLLTHDDPPLFMRYGMAPDSAPPDNPKRVEGWQVHHVTFGVALQEKAREVGVDAYLKYPKADAKFRSEVDFLRKHLLSK